MGAEIQVNVFLFRMIEIYSWWNGKAHHPFCEWGVVPLKLNRASLINEVLPWLVSSTLPLAETGSENKIGANN